MAPINILHPSWSSTVVSACRPVLTAGVSSVADRGPDSDSPSQLKPGSIRHFLEQPSPSKRFPSSHLSILQRYRERERERERERGRERERVRRWRKQSESKSEEERSKEDTAHAAHVLHVLKPRWEPRSSCSVQGSFF